MIDELPFKYRVNFGWEDFKNDVLPHGTGQIILNLSDPIVSKDDEIEIARFIGRKNGYDAVAIINYVLIKDGDEDRITVKDSSTEGDVPDITSLPREAE